MNSSILMNIIIFAILLLILLFAISSYNGLVIKRNRVKNAWAQIDVQLKKRFDLIPNLVETVKGYTKHEAGTLEAVVKARNQYISASKPEEMMEANTVMTGALSRLFALAESYPDLKANANFIELQGELSGLEEKIAYARQFYNDTVMIYNNAIQVVPTNIIANIFRFMEEPYFKADESERQNVKVQF
ncbi:MAG TPA: LemA family protein [Bacillota bacterium]|nr:LemA family protein [Bacillota bacterium]HOR86172.1 LemA family protein [Bacillota bacterium]HPL52750.1 LemA family protein [Bacillota bacterium]